MNRFRRTKIALIALIVALMAGFTAALFAQGGPGGGTRRGPGGGAAPFGPGDPGGRGFAAGFALGQLDLSDAQKQQVRDIMQRRQQELRPTLDRLQQAMQAQRAAINAVPVNEQAVRAAAANLAAAEADMAVEQARMHADIFAILTVEQQEKAKQLEAQGQARAQERRQRAPRQQKQPV